MTNDYTVFCGNEASLDGKRGNLAETISGWTSASAAKNEAVLAQSKETVLAQLQGGLCALLLDTSYSPIGYITTYYLGNVSGRKWWEVGTAIIPSHLRGHGLGKQLYIEIAKRHPRGILVATTKNPVALYISVKYAGFVIVPYTKIPREIRQGLCYEASCFCPINTGNLTCMHEHQLTVKSATLCFARVRKPLK